MKEVKVVVKWRAGLHARRAVDLVKLANRFQSIITIKKGDIEGDAKSIISIMTLEASYKTQLSIIVDGNDANEAVDAIVKLFNNVEK